MGHGNLSTTKRYAHPDERIKQNVMNTYTNLIENAKGDNKKDVATEETKQPKKFYVKRKINRVKSEIAQEI